MTQLEGFAAFFSLFFQYYVSVPVISKCHYGREEVSYFFSSPYSCALNFIQLEIYSGFKYERNMTAE